MLRSTYGEDLDRLWDLHKERLQWCSGPIVVKVQKTLVNEELVDVDLTETIGKIAYRKRNATDEDFYWLPATFNLNTDHFRKFELSSYFVNACIEAGFNIIMKGYEKSRMRSRFVCNRGRFHKQYGQKDPDKKSHDKRTFRPIDDGDECTCKFSFQVVWNEKHERWCLPKEQAGCPDHNGHPEREPNECRMFAKDYSKEAIDTVTDCLKVGIRPNQISALMHQKEGHMMDEAQIRHMRSQLRDATVINLESIRSLLTGRASMAHSHITSADRLIANLEKDCRYSYTALYAQQESELLKVYRLGKSKEKEGINDLVNREEINPNTLDDSVDKASLYVANVRKQLKITGTSSVLLACYCLDK